MHDLEPGLETSARAGLRRRATGIALIAAAPAACLVGGLGHESATLLGSGLLGLAGLTLVSERWRFGAKRRGMLAAPGVPGAVGVAGAAGAAAIATPAAGEPPGTR